MLAPGPGYAGSKNSSRPFRIRYPSLKEGNSGPAPKMLNTLLGNLGYVNGGGSSYSSATGRAVLAYRKVNGMARKEKATGKIFKKLAKGKGGFKLKHPGAGKHVETDLSRQVMVLAKHGEVDEIYTISSGAPATPTIQGKFRFYRKDAGLQQPRHVLLGLLHPRIRDPRLPRRADLSRQPRLPAEPDPRLGPHLQLDRPRRPDLRLLIGSTVSARETLIAELREHALVIGEVTLTSGATASYYVDAKRAILRQPAFGALGELVAAEANERGATAVGGMTMGADPIASAAIGDPAGRDLLAFFVRKEKKQHGLQRWVEGPLLDAGTKVPDRRGRGHDRRLDGEGDRALPRGGPGDRRHGLGPRPPGRRRREHRRGAERRPLPPPGDDRRRLPRAQ